MKKISLLLSVLFCFFVVSGTVFTTNSGPVGNVIKAKPAITKLKVPISFNFLFTNDLPNGLSYYFSGPSDVGGVVSGGSYAYIYLTAGTYNVSIVPTNGPWPVRANLVFNNGVYWDGDPGHNFTGVSIGTGSGQASAFTATVY